MFVNMYVCMYITEFYGGPQVHSEFQTTLPIPKPHSEFQNLTPNSKISLRIAKSHSEF